MGIILCCLSKVLVIISPFSLLFSFHAFGDFIFLRAQKNEASGVQLAVPQASSQKGAPAGGLHSANRFCGNTTYCGLHSWDAIRMSTANRTRTLYVMALSNLVL